MTSDKPNQGLRKQKDLLQFQREIINEVHNGATPEVLFSGPRGIGKTFLAAEIIADLIWEQSPLYQKGKEVVVVAGNLQQAGLLLNELSWMREAENYQISDSVNIKQIMHKEHRTAMRVVSSRATSALGLGANQSLIVADECSSWSAREGELMHQALKFSLGKPDSNTKILWISTIAPDICTFFGKMANETNNKKLVSFVYRLEDEDKWTDPEEVLRINPLKAAFEDTKQFLLDELEDAKNDYGKSVYFKNWILNFNTANEQQVLLTAPQIKTLFAKEPPPREGDFIVGVDLGSNTAFSAAAAVWQNGRVEGFAACSGIPAISERERNDGKPAGAYKALVDSGQLVPAKDMNTVHIPWFLGLIKERFGGEPFMLVADQFRFRELEDICDWYLEYRRTTTAEGSNFGIEAFRQYAADGGIFIDKSCQPLLALSIADSRVETDGSGLSRMVKKTADNTGRDDFAHALVLACDAFKAEFDLAGGTPTVFSLG